MAGSTTIILVDQRMYLTELTLLALQKNQRDANRNETTNQKTARFKPLKWVTRKRAMSIRHRLFPYNEVAMIESLIKPRPILFFIAWLADLLNRTEAPQPLNRLFQALDRIIYFRLSIIATQRKTDIAV